MADSTLTASQKANVYAMLAPVVFVPLWSTGFIGAKYGLPYAEPFTFLFVRFMIAAGLLFLLAGLRRSSRWPTSPKQFFHIVVAGLLMHAAYLGGVFAAIGYGMSAGVSAIIVGLQPVLTAFLAGIMLSETVSRRQWLGFVLGFGGVVLVVGDRMGLFAGNGGLESVSLSPLTVALAVMALVSITLATLYQKKFIADMPVVSGTAIQYGATTVAMGLLALQLETMEIQWTGDFIFALGWLVLVLSFGAVGLLLFLIRQNAAAKMASLFYLVPPCVAVIAYFLFGETLGGIALAGMAVAAAGVALVVTQKK